VALRESESVYSHMSLAMIHNALGHTTESDESLRVMIASWAADGAIQISEVCAARGERDEAFGWLERAYVQRDPGLAEMKLSVPLRSLHGDPRWGVFLRKMGLEE
jgi:hypothetical protein